MSDDDNSDDRTRGWSLGALLVLVAVGCWLTDWLAVFLIGFDLEAPGDSRLQGERNAETVVKVTALVVLVLLLVGLRKIGQRASWRTTGATVCGMAAVTAVGLALAGPLATSAGSNEALVDHVTPDHLMGLGAGFALAVAAVWLGLRATASHR